MLLLLIVVFFSFADLTFGRHLSNLNLQKFSTFKRRELSFPTKHFNQLPSNGEQSLCSEATVSFTFIDYDGQFANLTASSVLKLYSSSENDNLQVSNVTGWDSTHNTNMSQICYDDVNGFGCNQDLSYSYRFNLDKNDPFVDIDGYFGITPAYITQIYLGYANNGTLSNLDGTATQIILIVLFKL